MLREELEGLTIDKMLDEGLVAPHQVWVNMLGETAIADLEELASFVEAVQADQDTAVELDQDQLDFLLTPVQGNNVQ